MWLKANNPLYTDIEISEERLLELPEDGVENMEDTYQPMWPITLKANITSSYQKQSNLNLLHLYRCVQRAVVLYQTELPVLLFYKEDRGGHWRLGGSDLSRFKVFLQKGV